MKIILATAYDINPYKGSESGTGWHLTYQLSRFNKVIAITRENNQIHIDKFISENNLQSDNLKFVYFDLPRYMRFWKRGNKGAFVYYNLWQLLLPIFIWRSKLKFDVCQHLNFHADHVFSMLWVFNKPFIWGPVNHNEPIPSQFLLTTEEFVVDRFKFIVKWLRWHFDPLLIICKKRAKIVIGANTSVQKRLKIPSEKFHLLSTVSSIIESKPERDVESKSFTVLSVGRLVPIKCFHIAILSFNKFFVKLNKEEKSLARMIIVGDGPLKLKLKNLISSLESKDNIQLINWLDQSELFQIYEKASVMLVPSQEGAGAVVAEAMSKALPIICFDNYGAGELVNDKCGIKIPNHLSADKSCEEISKALKNLYDNKGKLHEKGDHSFKYCENNLSWNSKGEKLKKIHNHLNN